MTRLLRRLRYLLQRDRYARELDDELRFHLDMKRQELEASGLDPAAAALAARRALGNLPLTRDHVRDVWIAPWLQGVVQDYRLGLRMLLKYPGLTLAGGLALAVAIGIGAGWYDLAGKLLAPAIPLPAGDRLVLIETRNTLTNKPERRVVRDFLEWRRELRTIEDPGAYRTDTRNLVAGNAGPESLRMAELTAAAFRTARVTPLLGRGLLDADERPGAPGVVVLGYAVWQRVLGGRDDIVGSVVTLGNTPATVVGVMPEGFRYPVNHDAWTPLSLRASYDALEGGAISVVGALAPGATREQADAELRVIGERKASALPATHQHLRPRVMRPGETRDVAEEAPVVENIAEFSLRNGPVLLLLVVACTSVGTLVYARTATREREITVRFALGASRGRVIGQLFVEALVLASVAGAVGLLAADRAVTCGIESAYTRRWMFPGASCGRRPCIRSRRGADCGIRDASKLPESLPRVLRGAPGNLQPCTPVKGSDVAARRPVVLLRIDALGVPRRRPVGWAVQFVATETAQLRTCRRAFVTRCCWLCQRS